mgnify:CR=1 FL=1
MARSRLSLRPSGAVFCDGRGQDLRQLTELKKPEMAFKCFVRFILAQAAVMYGMELMTALFRIAQGMVSTIMDSSA